MRARAVVFLVAWAVASAAPAFAQRTLDQKDIPVADPELERRALKLDDGLDINLFAADPRIAKPIQMNFDPQGRLWIASSSVYPHIQPGQKADDKILVVEDRDGDGVAETTTVFADGLLIPTAVLPGDGGVYVGASTELLHFTDTDGDGKADKRRVILSGFGTEDTHHMIHTLRWGPRGFMYFNQSIYIHSHLETPHGVKRLGGGGIWRFQPRTFELDVLARGMVNSWGHQLDPAGVSFATDGAGGQGIIYIVPGASYETAVGASKILPGLNPGSPKYCGLEIIDGTHFPGNWRGSLITNDFRGHRVCRFVLSEQGSGYTSQQQRNVIETDHVAFRPIDVQVGPDGALYIADWYNPIIQHGEVDFRDPRRDHTHGRIWRVTAKGRPLASRPKFDGIAPRALLDQLKSPEGFARRQAQRLIAERQPPIAAELTSWIAALDASDPQVDRHRLEGLWARQAVRQVDGALLEQMLRSKDASVRAAAVRVLADWQPMIANAADLLVEAVGDRHQRVRLEAVRAIGVSPADAAGARSLAAAALRVLDQPVDQFLEYAAWLSARELEPSWMPAVKAGSFDFGSVRALIFALRAVGGQPAVAPLVKLFREIKIPADQVVDVLDLVARFGDAKDLQTVFDSAVNPATSPANRLALLTALADASAQRSMRPQGSIGQLGPLLESPDVALKMVALRCAGQWKAEPTFNAVVAIARGKEIVRPLRQAAMDAIAAMGRGDSVTVLEKFALSVGIPDAPLCAVIAMPALDVKRAATLAADRLAAGVDTESAERLVGAFLGRQGGGDALAAAIPGKKIASDVAKVMLRSVEASGGKQPALAAALEKYTGKSTATANGLPAAEMQQLVTEVREQGNAARGEAIFRRTELLCLKCHAIAGAGGRVGPDLISLGASAQLDYIADSLIAPNKAAKENFHTLVVSTAVGKVFTGIKLRQTDRELLLRDAEDKEIAVPLDSIDDQVAGTSIMPAGVVDKLTRAELVDLVRFLSELGKPGPYAVGPAATVRRWRAMAATDEAKYRIQRTSVDAVTADDTAFRWEPAYSNVAGELPLSDLPELKLRYGTVEPPRGVSCARFEFEVPYAGEFELAVNSVEGLRGWIDAAPLEMKSPAKFRAATGLHRITLLIDRNARTAPLRASVTGPAVMLVQGK